ncbi:unnamed protein product [Sympodiomycopsis kandeliae]
MTPLTSSAEVNLLVYHYLKDSGFLHTCFSLRHEARLDDDPLSQQAIVEPERLLKLLQKGLLFMSVEAHVNPDGSEKSCTAPFHLLGPPHVCDGKSRRKTSPEPTSTRPPQERLTPEPFPPPNHKQASSSIEVASQTDPLPITMSANGHNYAHHSVSAVASSSRHNLDGSNDVVNKSSQKNGRMASAISPSKRKASASVSASSALLEKKTKVDSADSRQSSRSASNIANGIQTEGNDGLDAVDADDQGGALDQEESSTTDSASLQRSNLAQNGKHTNGSGPASATTSPPPRKSKAQRDSVVSESQERSVKKASTKRGKAARSDNKLVDDEDVETRTEPPSRKGAKKATATSKDAEPKQSLQGKAQGKGIAPSNVLTLSGHRADVYASAWNPTVPDLIASAAGDATVRIWDLPGKDQQVEAPIICKHLPTTQTKDVATLDWNPDGTLLASGSHDGILRLWTPQGDLHLVMSMHQAPIYTVRWNRKGTMLLTGSGDGTAIVWDAGSGKVRQQFPIHSDGVLDVDWLVSRRVREPASTRHEMIFATASADNSIHLCRVGEARPIKTLRGHEDEVNSIRFDASQKLLASASDDLTAKIWVIDTNALLGSGNETSGRSKRASAGLSSTGKDRGASLALEASNSSMDVDRSDEELGPTRQQRASSTMSAGIAGSEGQENGRSHHNHHDSSSSNIVSSPGADKHGCLYTLRGHEREIIALQWAPTGPGSANPEKPRMLATCSYDGTARIWNADTGACIRVVAEHTEGVYGLCWSPDASILVTGGADNQVLVHRVKDGSILKAYLAGKSVLDITWHVSSESSSLNSDAIKSEDGSDSKVQQMTSEHRLGISSADRTLTILSLGTLEDLHAAVPEVLSSTVNGTSREPSNDDTAMKE